MPFVQVRARPAHGEAWTPHLRACSSKLGVPRHHQLTMATISHFTWASTFRRPSLHSCQFLSPFLPPFHTQYFQLVLLEAVFYALCLWQSLTRVFPVHLHDLAGLN